MTSKNMRENSLFMRNEFDTVGKLQIPLVRKQKIDTSNISLIAYSNNHYLSAEIAYHPEPKLTGNGEPVLHIHYYDKNFNRTKADYLDFETFNKYKKYLVGRKWYD